MISLHVEMIFLDSVLKTFFIKINFTCFFYLLIWLLENLKLWMWLAFYLMG